MPNPGDDFFKSVCKLVYNFLWKKRDRIKRHTLIGNIEQGGIGIIDVESKFKAAKSSWISRIIDKSSLIHRFITQLLKKHEITIFDVLKTSYCHEKKTVSFDKIDMPKFYIEVIDAFNECKKVKNVKDHNTNEFLQEIIWNNNIFLHKSEPLCFQNWMSCGILYAKDIFDENGRIYDITYFSNLIKKRHNILCEYLIIKREFGKYQQMFECDKAKHVNIKYNKFYLFKNNRRLSVENLKCNFYYNIFINMKFERPLFEMKWSRMFNVSERESWKSIYRSKIVYMYEKSIAEFNYKLLHGILNNNFSVNKWNKTVSPLCEKCICIEDVKHLLFDCQLTTYIWHVIGLYFNFEITWKIIVLGFYNEINTKTIRLNNIISFICYKIYKYKMKCRLLQENMYEIGLVRMLKFELKKQNTVLELAGKLTDNLYSNLSEIL